MELKNNRKVIMIAPLVVVIALIFGNAYTLIHALPSMNSSVGGKFMTTVNTAFAIFALVVAGLYFVSEFSKKSSKYFKFFLYLFIFTEFTSVLHKVLSATARVNSSQVTSATFVFDVVIGAIVYVALNILYFRKDLGKNLSLGLSYAVLIAQLMSFVVMLQVASSDTAVKSSLIFRGLAFVCLAIVLVIMQHLKYYDKSQRHTK